MKDGNDSEGPMRDWERAYAEGNTALGDELMDIEIEEDFLRLGELYRETDEAFDRLEAALRGEGPADIHEDAPLTLEQAVCLPELGGSFTVDPALRKPSETVKVKTLRGAIDRGEIVPGWKGKNLFVTRRMIREWLNGCQGQKTTRRPSRSDATNPTRGATSARHSGTSTTAASSITSDSARMILRKLRQGSGST